MAISSSPAETVAHLLTDCDVIDLGHPLEEGMPSFPSQPRFFHIPWSSFRQGDSSVSYQMIVGEHSGTHVDAPGHEMRDGHPQQVWMDEVAPTCLIGRAATIDVHLTPPGQRFGTDGLEAFEAQYGPIQPGDVVLFNTGWSSKWCFRPNFGPYLEGWSAPTPELCEQLVNRGVKAVGCDNLALDAAGDRAFPAHIILLGNGILIMENLTNLDRLPAFCGFVAIPLKIARGSGSPIRPLAFVPRIVEAEQLDGRDR